MMNRKIAGIIAAALAAVCSFSPGTAKGDGCGRNEFWLECSHALKPGGVYFVRGAHRDDLPDRHYFGRGEFEKSGARHLFYLVVPEGSIVTKAVYRAGNASRELHRFSHVCRCPQSPRYTYFFMDDQGEGVIECHDRNGAVFRFDAGENRKALLALPLMRGKRVVKKYGWGKLIARMRNQS